MFQTTFILLILRVLFHSLALLSVIILPATEAALTLDCYDCFTKIPDDGSSHNYRVKDCESGPPAKNLSKTTTSDKDKIICTTYLDHDTRDAAWSIVRGGTTAIRWEEKLKPGENTFYLRFGNDNTAKKDGYLWGTLKYGCTWKSCNDFSFEKLKMKYKEMKVVTFKKP